MTKKAAAGKRRHKVTFESQTTTKNATNGENTSVWKYEAQAWVAIEPVSAREVAIAKSFSARTSHKITILYRRDILPTWRVKYGSRIFTIDGIINVDESNVEQILYCSE